MPSGSTPREFARAIQTRRTKTTRALDRIFTNPGRHSTHANFAQLRIAHVLNTLPAWARARLPNLSPLELVHIDSWPNDQKNRVRASLVTAIQSNRKVRFFWELHSGLTEVTVIDDPDPQGGITIIFRSPRSKVRGGSVTVDV